MAGDTFWYSTTNNAIYTTGSVIIRGNSTSYDSPADVGPDVFFFVSGSKNCLTGSHAGAAVFGGDVRVSGSFVQGEHIGSSPIIAWGLSSHAIGRGTQARGNYSHAEGDRTLAIGSTSHAEGAYSEARGTTSHAEGYLAVASNAQSHAEGDRTLASGDTSHAEGIFSEASGDYSHAQGEFTLASGYASHAEGSYTTAVGSYSHAAGRYTIASGSAQTAVGKFNKRDNTTSLFVVGNGVNSSNSTRSDILRVNSGSIQITGSLWQMSGSSTTTIGFMGAGSGVPHDKGTDIFFYVSGSTGTDKSVFGGDLTVSGSFTAEGDLIEISGSLVIEANTLEITGSLIATGSFHVTGSTNVGTISEAFNYSISDTGTVSYNISEKSIFYVEAPTGDITANFTNVPTTSDRIITTTVILSQSSTPRTVSAVQIDGSSSAINWLDGSAPSGTANKQDVFSFNLIRSGSSWITLGQLSKYG